MPAFSQPASLAQTINAMRPKFVAQTAERLDRFEVLRDRLETEGSQTAILDELRIGAHKMSGLAAMLGWPDLGDLAGKVEVAIEKAAGGGVQPDQSCLIEVLDDLLGEMAYIVG